MRQNNADDWDWVNLHVTSVTPLKRNPMMMSLVWVHRRTRSCCNFCVWLQSSQSLVTGWMKRTLPLAWTNNISSISWQISRVIDQLIKEVTSNNWCRKKRFAAHDLFRGPAGLTEQLPRGTHSDRDQTGLIYAVWRYLCCHASAVLLIWTLSCSGSTFLLIQTSHTLRKFTNEHIGAAIFSDFCR